jgi:hypothetical protein
VAFLVFEVVLICGRSCNEDAAVGVAVEVAFDPALVTESSSVDVKPRETVSYPHSFLPLVVAEALSPPSIADGLTALTPGILCYRLFLSDRILVLPSDIASSPPTSSFFIANGMADDDRP